MKLLQSLSGMLQVQLTSADPAAAISALNDAGIPIQQAERRDDLCLQFLIRRQDLPALTRLAEKRGEELSIKRRIGLFWTLASLKNRKLLLLGLAILLALTVFIPTRVLFVRVEGNSTVPDRLILEKAAQCGIGFGASRREVRSERMKNALLGAVPELQWAGVNTYGCVAVISVRERTEPVQVQSSTGVSSIVAVRDAYITSATVRKGNALCRVGQTVKAGQVLVSGYTDCGLSIRVTKSEGEIFGQTQWDLSVITPAEYTLRRDEARRETRYSLIIGKNRINLYKDSGILDTSCVKMYSESYVTLPGDFQLPIAIVTERWIWYDTATDILLPETADGITQEFVQAYLQQQMVAGQILDADSATEQLGGIYCRSGKYTCLEMIGRERIEEIATKDE